MRRGVQFQVELGVGVTSCTEWRGSVSNCIRSWGIIGELYCVAAFAILQFEYFSRAGSFSQCNESLGKFEVY